MAGRASALGLFALAVVSASFMACIDRLDEDPMYLDAGHFAFDAAPHDGALGADGAQDATGDSPVGVDASHDGAVGDASPGADAAAADAGGNDSGGIEAGIDAATLDASIDAPSFDAPIFDSAPIDGFVPPDGGLIDVFVLDSGDAGF